MTTLINRVLLNQYRVDAFIASGGMGAVFRVWDLKRNVPLAMKVLHADLAEDPSIFKRFQREANALKKLTHPNIVPFYGLHHTQDFTFILEAYVDGPTLKDVLRARNGKPLPVSEALTYLKTLSAALGYAHVHGVVHCDVKPGNIIIDRGGQIYLTDFGIARHAESTTTTLGAAGTPAYMAPEQIRGKAVSPATDVYALGVLLFEILTGQRPFRGDEKGTESAGATANERTRYAHLHLPPPDARLLNLSIPEGLAQVIQKALAKDPQARFSNIQDMFRASVEVTREEISSIDDRVSIAPELTLIYSTTNQAVNSDILGRESTVRQSGGNKRGLLIAIAAALIVFLLIAIAAGSSRGGFAQITPNTENNSAQASIPILKTSTTSPRVPTVTNPVTLTDLPTLTAEMIPSETPITFIKNPVDHVEVIQIPEGTFRMGSNRNTDPYFFGAEGPEHEIYLDTYWIYRTEVTNAMYQACVAQKKCPIPSSIRSNTRSDYYENPKYGDFPVINVSWRNADAYCKWAGGRLPTEAEWEKAGRGTDGRLYPWGTQGPNNSYLNFNSSDTVAVGRYLAGASPYGALDMAGNVIEWVFDQFDPTYYSKSPEKNPVGPANTGRRVYRGRVSQRCQRCASRYARQ